MLYRLLRTPEFFITPWSILAAILIGLFAGYVFGQTEPHEQPAPAPAAAHEPPAADHASAVMQQHGGSLLRATLAATPDPQQAKLAGVSFFHVPEPEPRTVKKHDLVTIVIREESDFSSQGTTEANRSADLSAKLEEFLNITLEDGGIRVRGGGVGTGNPVPSIKANATRNFKGEGTVDRTDSFTARITAEVVDVKPNNTLVVQARKKIVNDEEVQEFLLTGTCRAEDITADNSVLSTQLFDLDLTKKHKGNVRDATKRGLVGRLLDFLNPF